MTREQILIALEEYIELVKTEWDKPTWFECLTFLSGYFDHISPDMVMVVRKLQREGRVE